MADRSTGPVQPPVIDLTARSADAPPGEDAARDDFASAPPPPRPVWPLLAMTMAGGAVLGVLLTYLLANVAPLPGAPPAGPDLAPELAAQSERIDTLAGTLGALQQSTTRTQVSLDATITQLDTGFTELRDALASVEARIPAPAEPIDLTALETELRTLAARVDAIAAGASGDDASAIAQSIAALDAGLARLGARLDGVDQSVGTLRADLDAARAALAQHIDAALPDEAGPAMKLPLILSGLEAAFGSGRPFLTELEALSTVLPGFAVSPALAAAAGTGLARPDALAARLNAAIPDILAARDPGASGDWTQDALDWASALLALRPIDETAGSSPAAIMSRLEAAMERRDYRAALALLEQLPAPMRAAAAPVDAELRLHADADALVAALRARALTDSAAT
jgi:hypothetical protein